MQALARDQIVGKRIVCVHAKWWHDDGNDLSFCDAVIDLESGLAFRIPGFADETLAGVRVDSDLEPVDMSKLPGVMNERILTLLRPNDNEDFYPGSASLVLENGVVLRHESCCPMGVGGAGVFLVRPGDCLHPYTPTSEVDYWTGMPVFIPALSVMPRQDPSTDRGIFRRIFERITGNRT